MRDDIIKMAREAGVDDWWDSGNEQREVLQGVLERFAALVAAAEREACAKVCEGRIGGAVQSNEWWGGFREAMKQCADAIRARGKV